MEVTIELPELRKRKLFVGLPQYSGQCTSLFARSISDLTALGVHYGLDIRLYFLMNESLIPRARNYCVDEFLRSDYTHFLFIDADIGFNAQDVITMLVLQSDESPYDVLAAPYVKKCISAEKILQAANAGKLDEDPERIHDYIGDYVFNPAPGTTEIKLSEPAEVMETGTGFMMIRRATFDKFKAAYPEQSYKPDHVRTEHFDGSREIVAYFDCPIDPDSRRYMSEDYMFCSWCRKIGMKVWLCPFIELQHVGMLVFGGKLAAMAELNISPTCDPSLLKKNRQKKEN